MKIPFSATGPTRFWIDIGDYDFIIDAIRDGYKIPFYSSSPSVYLSNNMSGSKNANFVDTVLQDLLHRDLIVKCNKHLLWLIHNSFYSIKQKEKINS